MIKDRRNVKQRAFNVWLHYRESLTDRETLARRMAQVRGCRRVAARRWVTQWDRAVASGTPPASVYVAPETKPRDYARFIAAGAKYRASPAGKQQQKVFRAAVCKSLDERAAKEGYVMKYARSANNPTHPGFRKSDAWEIWNLCRDQPQHEVAQRIVQETGYSANSAAMIVSRWVSPHAVATTTIDAPVKKQRVAKEDAFDHGRKLYQTWTGGPFDAGLIEQIVQQCRVSPGVAHAWIKAYFLPEDEVAMRRRDEDGRVH